MPHFEPVVSDPETIQRLASGVGETAAAVMLGKAPVIVGRNCGETWPRSDCARAPRSHADLDHAAPAAREVLEAKRTSLVTYSGGADRAWAAKIDGDILLTGAPRRSRIPLTAAALASALFIAAFLGGREAAVAALPDLAGLYGSIGMPVNLDGLEIRAIEAQRRLSETTGRVSVQGEILNVTGKQVRIPPLHVSFYDKARTPVGSRGFDPPGRVLDAGDGAPFTLELDGVPQGAAAIAIRFRRPGEPGPASLNEFGGVR